MTFVEMIRLGAEEQLKGSIWHDEDFIPVVLSEAGSHMVLVQVPPFENEKEKLTRFAWAIAAARYFGSNVMGLVMDAWMVRGGLEDMTVAPSQHPKRVEGLVTLIYDGNEMHRTCRTYMRVGKSIEWLEDWRELSGEATGWMSSIFKEIVEMDDIESLELPVMVGMAVYGEENVIEIS